MPLQVAQLNIIVTTDGTQSLNTLGQVQAAYAAAAQAAVQGASQEASAQQEVTAALSAVVLAVRNQTAAVVGSVSEVNSSLQGLSSNAGNTRSNLGTIGSSGVASMLQLNQAFVLSGQSLGPVNGALLLVASGLSRIPQNASLAQKSITAIGTAVTALGALIINFSAKQQDAKAQLEAALGDSDKSIGDYTAVIKQAESEGTKWGKTTADTDHALSTLARTTNSASQELEAYVVAANIAAARTADGSKLSLSGAADTVARAMEGQSRAVRVLGLQDLNLVTDPTKKLTAAQTTLAEQTARVTNETQSVTEAQQRYADAVTLSQLKVDGLAKAQQNLQQAQQALKDLQDKNAIEDATPSITHAQQAADTLANAQQRLLDIQQEQAAAAKEAAVAAASNTAANSPETLLKLADASQKVLDAQEKLAGAQGGDISKAQDQLRASVDAQRKALDNQAQKQKEEALAATGQSAQKIRDAATLRDATDAVVDAQTKLTQAQKLDVSEAQLNALNRTKEMRSATDAVAAAQNGVTQALKDQEAQVIKLADAHYAVDRALRQLSQDQQKQMNDQKKVSDLQDTVANQGQKVLDALNSRTKGTADAMSNTIGGTFRNWTAELQNFLGHFGSGIGTAALLAYPLVGILGKIGGLLGIGGGAAAAGEAAGVGGAAAEGGMLASLGEVAASAGPIGAAAVAVVGVGVGLYEAYKNVKWFHSAVNDTASFLKTAGVDAWHAFNTGARDVGGAVEAAGRFVKNLPGTLANVPGQMLNLGEDLFKSLYNGAVGLWNNTFWPFIKGIPGWIVDQLGNLVGDMFNLGGNIISGLWNGIKSAASGLWSGIKDIGKGIVNTAKDAVGAKSPSVIFHQIGEDIMAGLANGLQARAGDPKAMLEKTARALASVPFSMGTTGAMGVSLGQSLGLYGPVGQQGGVTIHNYNVDIRNAGSVIAQKDLIQQVKNGLTQVGFNQGGNALGGFG